MLQQIADFAPNAAERERALKWLSFIESHIEGWPFGGENHLKSHWCRTLMLALNIADGEGFCEADREALAAAAAFHDTRRKNAWPDQGHGARGAAYYEEFCRARGLAFDPRIAQVMTWHDCDDSDGIQAIRAWEEANPELRPEGCASAVELYLAFKDADGLDRVRLALNVEMDEDSEYWRFALDPNYLRLETSKNLIPLAKELLAASQGLGAARAQGDDAPPQPYLVVVDVQNDFVTDALGTAEAQTALPAMVKKVREFDGQVVFTKDTHDDRYMETQEGKNLPVPHCLVGTRGWELVDELDAFQRERNLPVYLKGTFGSIDLMRDIVAAHARGKVASIEFIGLCTDICVISNAMLVKAALPQLPVSVDAACCAGVTPALHDAALAAMASCQIAVK